MIIELKCAEKQRVAGAAECECVLQDNSTIGKNFKKDASEAWCCDEKNGKYYYFKVGNTYKMCQCVGEVDKAISVLREFKDFMAAEKMGPYEKITKGK